MLDNDDGVTGVDEALEDVDEAPDVGEMQPSGRLIKDVQGTAGTGAGKLGAELEALGLTAGEGGG